ncbi:hypothetical protein BDZ91DRAFT_725701 [Kalaharituber pfeilii]|nr:hypothetical protein BDZ91DRAFT_725701 [Kalaharituber pfeilii]
MSISIAGGSPATTSTKSALLFSFLAATAFNIALLFLVGRAIMVNAGISVEL